MSAVDKAKNKAEELAGKAKEKIGQATDDSDLEAEGATRTRPRATSRTPARR